MSRRLYRDWNRLIGVPVEIRQYGRVVRSGVVDDVMPDSSMLWLMADSAHGRTLFHAAEDYEVWIEPELLEAHHLLQVAAPISV
jgi:hypothetical protein